MGLQIKTATLKHSHKYQQHIIKEESIWAMIIRTRFPCMGGLGYSNRGHNTKEFMTVHGSAYVRGSGTCTKHIRGLPKKLEYKQKRTIGTSAVSSKTRLCVCTL